jgi:hypothetical protein
MLVQMAQVRRLVPSNFPQIIRFQFMQRRASVAVVEREWRVALV